MVKMASKLTFGTAIADWQEGIKVERMRTGRGEKARRGLNKHGRLARNWVNEGCGPEATEEEAKLFAEGIHRELAERKLTGEKLAVVGFDGTATQALAAKGRNVGKGWPLMLEATKTKTVDEINCLKMAYAISDNAWMQTWELLKPGARETRAG